MAVILPYGPSLLKPQVFEEIFNNIGVIGNIMNDHVFQCY
jgi:hypothetical protein